MGIQTGSHKLVPGADPVVEVRDPVVGRLAGPDHKADLVGDSLLQHTQTAEIPVDALLIIGGGRGIGPGLFPCPVLAAGPGIFKSGIAALDDREPDTGEAGDAVVDLHILYPDILVDRIENAGEGGLESGSVLRVEETAAIEVRCCVVGVLGHVVQHVSSVLTGRRIGIGDRVIGKD